MKKTVEAQGPVDGTVRPKRVAWTHSFQGQKRIGFTDELLSLPDDTSLYTIPEGWRQEIEELFGEYLDCAYQEGHMNRPDGNKANQILHRLRQLLPNADLRGNEK